MFGASVSRVGLRSTRRVLVIGRIVTQRLSRLVRTLSYQCLSVILHASGRRSAISIVDDRWTRPLPLAIAMSLLGSHSDVPYIISSLALLAIARNWHVHPWICRSLSAWAAFQVSSSSIPCAWFWVPAAFCCPSFPSSATSPANRREPWSSPHRLWRRTRGGPRDDTINVDLSSHFAHACTTTGPEPMDAEPRSGSLSAPSSPPHTLAPVSIHRVSTPPGAHDPQSSAARQVDGSDLICPTCLTGLNWCVCRRNTSSESHGPSLSNDTAVPPPPPPFQPSLSDVATRLDSTIGAGSSSSRAAPGPPASAWRRPDGRLLCPVNGCPCNQPDYRGWADLETIKGHINGHLSGQYGGSIPDDWLSANRKTTCRHCGLLCAASRGIHNSCSAAERNRTTQTGRGHESRGVASGSNVVAPSSDDLPSLDEIHRKHVLTVKHVPHTVRSLWARCLIRALAAAVFFNSHAAWTEFAMLPKCVLCTPPRGGKAHANAAANFTADRLSRWLAGERQSLWADAPSAGRGSNRRSRRASTKQRETQAIAFAREGFDRKACAALVAEGIVDPCRSNLDKLKPLHPVRAPLDAVPAQQLPASPNIDSEAILQALRSFPRDSAPGPTGLRAQHLLDALTLGHSSAVLEQLAACSSLLASGAAPASIAPYFAGASLMAIEKKGGGLRPIAIGEILRRLVGKVLCQNVKQAAQTYFWPRQVGVGSPLGADCAIHTVRQWCQRHSGDSSKVVLKLDFENAFNTVDRAKALAELRAQFPGLARWAHWCYGSHSNLFFGDFKLDSATGVQQGDPLGPLLFACCVQPLVLSIDRLFRLGQHADPDGITCSTSMTASSAATYKPSLPAYGSLPKRQPRLA